MDVVITEMVVSYGNTVIEEKKALDPSFFNKKPRHFGGVSRGI